MSSYTASQSQIGSQTLFNINTGTPTTPTYVVISEVTDFSQSGRQNKTADVTNLQSTAEEFLATIQSPGSYQLTFNRVSTDPGQIALVASFVAKTLIMYQVTLPKTSAQITKGDVYVFTALVETLEDLSSVSPTKQVVSKATLKVSGPITLTVGS